MFLTVALLVGCGGGDKIDKNEALRWEAEKLRKEKAAQEARIQELKEQLEAEAAAKAQLIEKAKADELREEGKGAE